MKKRFLSGLAAVLLICFIAVFFAAAEETDPTEFYYSLDRESKDELPGNLRFLTKDRYELKEPRHWRAEAPRRLITRARRAWTP